MRSKKINFKQLLFILIICVCGTLQINAQSNKKIAYSYIRKANAAIEKSIDYAEALINFNKAMEYMDVITDKNVASLGARSYYEIHHTQRTIQRQIKFLEISNKYSQQYFALAKNKHSNDYEDNLELYTHAKSDLKKLRYALRRKSMGKF
ncbi:hypothetical protein BW723_07695 [Polaribacter reichenbachii]|uniref:Uncharacterized protein n=1 Tax=Polaribacter reichenbachii TaxID=996801 RepID=A0A1B8U682_9FLAO|nr:hypothetical protein [Polaribacter reichenbachii]APZ46187.1 hypothetical protein BW723_07695 [Polaribacter reichenbachii]AUC20049.1 hypothetical protein BTO17_15715 [Polaribacter reichenbachii]OBY67403.1 hypothetical protein LPB301_01795 [Polaribacter reichenbachii]